MCKVQSDKIPAWRGNVDTKSHCNLRRCWHVITDGDSGFFDDVTLGRSTTCQNRPHSKHSLDNTNWTPLPPPQKKMRKVNQLYLQLVLSGPIDVLASLSPHRNTGGKENTQESILGPKVLAGFSPFFLILVHFL